MRRIELLASHYSDPPKGLYVLTVSFFCGTNTPKGYEPLGVFAEVV